MAHGTSAEAIELEENRNGQRGSLSSGPYPGINFPATIAAMAITLRSVDTAISNATIARTRRMRRRRNATIASVFLACVLAKRFLRVSLGTERRTREKRIAAAERATNDLQKQFVRDAKSCGRIPRTGSLLSGSRRSWFSRWKRLILRGINPKHGEGTSRRKHTVRLPNREYGGSD